jgi:type I restriction enzyme S subunit
VSFTLKPYPEYRDSGRKWLRDIPAHWNVTRCKYMLRELNFRSEAGTETLLSVSQYTGVTPRGSRNGSEEQDTRAESLAGYKVAATNDLVVNTMLAWNGSLGIATANGIVSPAYAVYRFNKGNLPLYFHFLFRTQMYKGRFKVASTGVVESRLRLYPEDLLRVEALVPSLEEQHLIATFVAFLNRRVDKLIRAKRRVIELLNEQKQAIIQHAVTRGLDPSVRLKPSGLDYLSYVPEHWRVVKLSYVARITNGSTPSRMRSTYWDGGTIPWLASGKVNDGVIHTATEYVTEKALHECSISIIPAGAVVLGMVGQGKTRGQSAYLGIDACINQNLAAVIPRPQLDGHFLRYLLMALYQTIRNLGRGGNQEALNCEIVANLRILLPSLLEQAEIVAHLKCALAQLEEASLNATREIDLLREYRTRLIADVVTGKLDVREVELPELNGIEKFNDLEDEELEDSEELEAVEESPDAD